MITLRYDDNGTQKAVQIMAESLGDLTPVMPRFTAWMRKQVQAEFESAGNGTWAPRKDATQAVYNQTKAARIAKIQAGRYGTLSRSLKREKKRAERRLAKTPNSKSQMRFRRAESVVKYEEQIAEVARLSAGEHGPLAKPFRKLGERVARRDERAQQRIAAVERGDLLGLIAASITAEWSKDNWEMASRIPWAGIHNEGGTANNGAEIPRRTFLEWTPDRVEMFAKMANEYIMERAERAAAQG